MGYYRDEFKLDLNLARHIPAVADAAPVVIQLEDLIASKPVEKANHVDEPETCLRRRRTSTGRKSKGGGLEFEWPSDDSLAANSTFHVSQGHWAFDTVNGSCWNTAAGYLAQTAADFVAVQETTTLEDSIADTEQAARNKCWQAAISPCILTMAEGRPAGTAVCSRTHLGARKSFAEECIDKLVQARFQMKLLGRCAREASILDPATFSVTGSTTVHSISTCCNAWVLCWLR